LLLDWVEKDMLILETIPTTENVSDAMKNMLSRNLFYRRVPDYCDTKTMTQTNNLTPNITFHTSHKDPAHCSNRMKNGGRGTRHM
jgi:hypothetical protein